VPVVRQCFDTSTCANDAACQGHYCTASTQCGTGGVCSLNTATYYGVSSNAPAGQNVNAFGCANPAVCKQRRLVRIGNEPGWPVQRRR